MASMMYQDGNCENNEIALSEVEGKCEDGTIEDSTQVWMDGMDGWADFGDAMEFIMSKMESGPVTEFMYAVGEEQLEATAGMLPVLVDKGTIDDATLIYHEGMDAWARYDELKASKGEWLGLAVDGATVEEAAAIEAANDEAEAANPMSEAANPLSEEPDAIPEGTPPAAVGTSDAETAAAKKVAKAAADKQAAEDASAAVDVDSPVFQGKLKAMVADGLPEAHCGRCLIAMGGDLEMATDLLQGVMDSIGAAASMAAMDEEEVFVKVDELMEEIDTFKAGSISFRQFLSWIKRQSGQKRLSDEMNARGQALFNEFDHDDACCLDREKMKNCLIAMEKDAMFGSVMESLMAEKMEGLEAAIAAAEEEAKAAAEEAALAAAEAAAAEEAAAEEKAKADAEAAEAAAALLAAEEKAVAEAAAAAAAEAKAAEEAAQAAAEAAAAKAAAEAAAAAAAAEIAAAKAAGDAAAAAAAEEAAAAAAAQAEEERLAAEKQEQERVAAEEEAKAKAAAEAAKTAAEAKAATEKAAAAAAAVANAGPLSLEVDSAKNNVVFDPVERSITFDEEIAALAGSDLVPGESFALSGLGDADGVYTVRATDGANFLIVVEELPCISSGPEHQWVPGTDDTTITEGTVSIKCGAAALAAARRKQGKEERKDLLPAYRRTDGDKVVKALKEDPNFRTAMEEMTCDFVEFQLGSVKIPTIDGSKEWGTYNIENLGIKSFEIKPKNCTMSESGSQRLLPTMRPMSLKIADIAVVMDDFTFGFDKKTFPKVKEEGATAKISATFNAELTFKIMCNKEDGLSAYDVRAEISCEETPIEVLQGKHKKLYNMLLKAFAERVKFTIEEQLGMVLAASTPLLKKKLTSKFTEVANDPSLLDLIMETLEEKALRKLFNSLDKRKRGRLNDQMIGELLKQLGEWTMVLPKKVEATRIEINGGDEDETEVELDSFLDWWKTYAHDEKGGPTSALIVQAMGRREVATPPLGSALAATRNKIGRPEPLSRPPS